MNAWARQFDRCRDCDSVSSPHRAKGLCGPCYERAASRRRREHHRDNRRRGVRGELLCRLSPEGLRHKYSDLGRSIPDIARELGCSGQYVHDLLLRWSIPVRSRREARLLAIEQGKIPGHRGVHVDERFFKVWSAPMAYVLGLVATDGCVLGPHIDARTGLRKAGVLAFAQRDRELLDKVLALMKCDAQVRFRPGRQFTTTVAGPMHYVRVANPHLLASLVEHGIGPRKSRTLRFPAVPKEFLRDFMRGCWDGDGSIFRGRNLLIASYVSGSRDFIDGLVHKLAEAGFSRRTVYVEQRRNPSFKISFQGSEAVRLCAYMYDGVSEGARLNRKFEVYESFLRGPAAAAAR